MATGGGFIVNCNTYGTYLCWHGENWIWTSDQSHAYKFPSFIEFLRVVKNFPGYFSSTANYRLVRLVQPTKLEEQVLVD